MTYACTCWATSWWAKIQLTQRVWHPCQNSDRSNRGRSNLQNMHRSKLSTPQQQAPTYSTFSYNKTTKTKQLLLLFTVLWQALPTNFGWQMLNVKFFWNKMSPKNVKYDELINSNNERYAAFNAGLSPVSTDNPSGRPFEVTRLSRAWKWLRKTFKNLKSPKFRVFYFLVKFYTNHIKFHILISICEFCYMLQKMLWKRVNCVAYRMFFLGGNFCPVFFGHLNLKKP